MTSKKPPKKAPKKTVEPMPQREPVLDITDGFHPPSEVMKDENGYFRLRYLPVDAGSYERGELSDGTYIKQPNGEVVQVVRCNLTQQMRSESSIPMPSLKEMEIATAVQAMKTEQIFLPGSDLRFSPMVTKAVPDAQDNRSGLSSMGLETGTDSSEKIRETSDDVVPMPTGYKLSAATQLLSSETIENQSEPAHLLSDEFENHPGQGFSLHQDDLDWAGDLVREFLAVRTDIASRRLYSLSGELSKALVYGLWNRKGRGNSRRITKQQLEDMTAAFLAQEENMKFVDDPLAVLKAAVDARNPLANPTKEEPKA